MLFNTQPLYLLYMFRTQINLILLNPSPVFGVMDNGTAVTPDQRNQTFDTKSVNADENQIP